MEGGKFTSIIVKKIAFPNQNNHPRGWNTTFSHKRKVKSYQVEKAWYSNWNQHLNENCKTAKCLGIFDVEEYQILLLEDLNSLGFDVRKSHLTIDEVKICLSWLANFHAININKSHENLWEIGSYWHLKTRSDEFDKMPESLLKDKASEIDEKLNSCKYKIIIHGDAKVANFCFNNELTKVAAVDFQYVGSGCGIKDVMYLFSSCLSSEECEENERTLLDYYFIELRKALNIINSEINFLELEQEWRNLYSIAWADFIRFLQGWSPNHYKINNYSLMQVDLALEALK